MTRYAKVEITTSHQDWVTIRDCYVQSFRKYPLYKYMVPDDSKRDEFLRAYLDANCDVTVGSDQGLLFAMRVHCPEEQDVADSVIKLKEKIVGGVLFVPPAKDGCGWAIDSDEPYWQAYEKHGLARISAEALERVKRYEAWENKNVAEKGRRSRIPLWNGLFCAMLPEYTSRGFGSAVYKEVIQTLAKHELDCQITKSHPRSNGPCSDTPSKVCRKCSLQTNLPHRSDRVDLLDSPVARFCTKYLHSFALLSHRQLPHNMLVSSPTHSSLNTESQNCGLTKNSSTTKLEGTSSALTSSHRVNRTKAPLVVAITHSERAANFHSSNGFHALSRFPFCDGVKDEVQFYVHVLALDPYCTRRVEEFNAALMADTSSDNNVWPKTAEMTKLRSSSCGSVCTS